jgi:hypothetical protein
VRADIRDGMVKQVIVRNVPLRMALPTLLDGMRLHSGPAERHDIDSYMDSRGAATNYPHSARRALVEADRMSWDAACYRDAERVGFEVGEISPEPPLPHPMCCDLGESWQDGVGCEWDDVLEEVRLKSDPDGSKLALVESYRMEVSVMQFENELPPSLMPAVRENTTASTDDIIAAAGVLSAEQPQSVDASWNAADAQPGDVVAVEETDLGGDGEPVITWQLSQVVLREVIQPAESAHQTCRATQPIVKYTMQIVDTRIPEYDDMSADQLEWTPAPDLAAFSPT